MSTPELRKRIKKEIDRLPPERLISLADFVAFLNRPPLDQRLYQAQKSINRGEGVAWRKVRSDV